MQVPSLRGSPCTNAYIIYSSILTGHCTLQKHMLVHGQWALLLYLWIIILLVMVMLRSSRVIFLSRRLRFVFWYRDIYLYSCYFVFFLEEHIDFEAIITTNGPSISTVLLLQNARIYIDLNMWSNGLLMNNQCCLFVHETSKIIHNPILSSEECAKHFSEAANNPRVRLWQCLSWFMIHCTVIRFAVVNFCNCNGHSKHQKIKLWYRWRLMALYV